MDDVEQNIQSLFLDIVRLLLLVATGSAHIFICLVVGFQTFVDFLSLLGELETLLVFQGDLLKALGDLLIGLNVPFEFLEGRIGGTTPFGMSPKGGKIGFQRLLLGV